MNRVTITIIGAVLFLMGFLALLLGLIGLSLTPLMFIERAFSPLGAFIAKITLLVLGFILFYVGRLSDDDSPEIPVES